MAGRQRAGTPQDLQLRHAMKMQQSRLLIARAAFTALLLLAVQFAMAAQLCHGVMGGPLADASTSMSMTYAAGANMADNRSCCEFAPTSKRTCADLFASARSLDVGPILIASDDPGVSFRLVQPFPSLAVPAVALVRPFSPAVNPLPAYIRFGRFLS